jgi:hypothetical protein
MHTQPSSFPASLMMVHTSFPVPLPLQGVVHVPLSAVVGSQAGGVALGW